MQRCNKHPTNIIMSADDKCIECLYEMVDVAMKVHKVLSEDGVHGPYVLGEELWNKFNEVFKNANC